MQELETLLNSLIKMGWKAKDREIVSIALDPEFTKSEWKTVFYCSCRDWFWFYADLGWLVSLESGLWQFITNNKLFNKNLDIRTRAWDNLQYDIYDYKYRLLESSLIPEEGLGKFLVDNIVIEWPLQNPQMDQILADREEG